MRTFCFHALFGVLALAALAACTSGGDDAAAEAPDVSDIAVELAVERFEHDLYRAAQDSTRNGAAALRAAYPVFFDSVWVEIMAPGAPAGFDSMLVSAFRTEPTLVRVLDSVRAAFPATGEAPAWQRDLERALRYARYYFPEEPTPRVVTYLSEFSLGGFSFGDSLVGIGLDFYLGSGFPGYDPNVFPRYIQRTMNADHVAPRAVEAWLGNLLGEAPGPRMLDRMVHNGKLLYLKSRLLPHVADTAVLGFGESSLAWLRDNEQQLWAHYLDQELLYETKGSRIGKLVGPSPNAPGMPPEAPGANANWVGMRIVEQYVARRPGLTMAELIAERDAQRLLTESKYKPR